MDAAAFLVASAVHLDYILMGLAYMQIRSHPVGDRKLVACHGVINSNQLVAGRHFSTQASRSGEVVECAGAAVGDEMELHLE